MAVGWLSRCWMLKGSVVVEGDGGAASKYDKVGSVCGDASREGRAARVRVRIA